MKGEIISISGIGEEIEKSNLSSIDMLNLQNVLTTVLDESTKKILVFGSVQSGKTQNMIKVSERLLEDHYEEIILLTGTKGILDSQTNDRFKSYFQNYNNIVVRNASQIKLSSNNIKYITISIKHPTYLKKIKKYIMGNTNKKILLIDDEADHASPNNNNSQSSKKTVLETPTHKIISEISSLENVKILSYTATPQGILLGGRSNSLFPDKAVALIENEGYFGLRNIIENNSNYCEIEDVDMELNTNGELTDDLKGAIDYFCSTALKYEKTGKKDKYNMVIHNSSRKESHKMLIERINIYINSNHKIIDIKVIEVNQDNKERNNIFTNENHSILVGGEMLSRGFTIPNLLVFYSAKESKENKHDTVYQRMRFCGYREPYAKDIKVFASRKMYENYTEIYKNTKMIISAINDMNNVYDNKVWFIAKKGTGLVPTRKGVLNKCLSEHKYSSSNIIINYYENEDIENKYKNNSILENKVQNLEKIVSKSYLSTKGEKYNIYLVNEKKLLNNIFSNIILDTEVYNTISNIISIYNNYIEENDDENFGLYFAVHPNIYQNFTKKGNYANVRSTSVVNNRITFIGTSETNVLEVLKGKTDSKMVVFIRNLMIKDQKTGQSSESILFDFHFIWDEELYTYELP